MEQTFEPATCHWASPSASFSVLPFLVPFQRFLDTTHEPATCHRASLSTSVSVFAGCLLATSFDAAELDQIRTLEGRFVSAVVDAKGSVLVSETKGKHLETVELLDSSCVDDEVFAL